MESTYKHIIKSVLFKESRKHEVRVYALHHSVITTPSPLKNKIKFTRNHKIVFKKFIDLGVSYPRRMPQDWGPPQ